MGVQTGEGDYFSEHSHPFVCLIINNAGNGSAVRNGNIFNYYQHLNQKYNAKQKS